MGPTGPAGSPDTGEQIIAKINASTSAYWNQIDTAHIANMERRFLIPAAAWVHSDGPNNFAAANPSAPVHGRVFAQKLPDGVVSAISSSFVIPSDFVETGPLRGNDPPFVATVLWSTNAASSNKKVHCELRFCKSNEIADGSTPVPLRYTFKANATGNFFVESANPATNYTIVTNKMPKLPEPLNWPDFDGYDFTGAPGYNTIPGTGDPWPYAIPWQQGFKEGEFVIITIVRYGDSTDDPNDGDMFIIGVEFHYHAVL